MSLGAPHSPRRCRDIPSKTFLPGSKEGLSRGLVPLLQSCAAGPDPAPGVHLAAAGCGGEKPGKGSKPRGVRLSPSPTSLSIHLSCAGAWVGAIAPRGLVPPGPSHALIYCLATLTCPPLLSRRTLNNNNITSIPVSSFNHMPKLRTL